MTQAGPLRVALEALDTLSGVLLSPSATMARVTERRPAVLAVITAVSVAIISGLVLVPNPPELAEDILDLKKGTLSLWSVLPLWVILFMAVLALQAAFLHLTASALKARGSPGETSQGGSCATSHGGCGTSRAGFRGIFCGLCFAYLPGLFSAPLIMLRALLASERVNAAYQVVFPLFCLWVFFLGVTAVRQNYGLPPARAAAVCAFAFAVLVVLPFVAGAVVMTRVMGG